MSIVSWVRGALVLTFIGLGLVTSSRVFAQPDIDSSPPSSFRADGLGSPDTFTSVTRHRRLESVLGREVRTRVEEDVGRIVDLLADRQGKVQAAVIEFGGFLGIGTRKIAVEWSALSFESDGRHPVIVVDMTRNRLRVAPEYKPNEPAVVRRVAD
jgi:PRC-barrel domain